MKFRADHHELRKWIHVRKLELEKKRAPYEALWKSIRKVYEPALGHALKGDIETSDDAALRDDEKIYNSKPRNLLHRMAAGLQSGITNQARQWFRFQPTNQHLKESKAVRKYLDNATETIQAAMNRSNIYPALDQIYTRLAAFGTSAALLVPDDEADVRLIVCDEGAYWISENRKGRVDTLMRRMRMPYSQMIAEFGERAMPTAILEAYREGRLEETATVYNLVYPREQGPKIPDVLDDRLFVSIYWIEGEICGTKEYSNSGILAIRSFDYNPIIAPRWSVMGKTAYGCGPGQIGLGDALELQQLELDSLEIVEQEAHPSMAAPASMRGMPLDTGPGGIVYYPDSQGGHIPIQRTFGTLPYMAAAAIPYGGGIAVMAMTAANEMEEQVALAGGDVTDPEFRMTKFIASISYAMVERMQLGIFKGLGNIDKRVLYAEMFHHLNSALKVGGITLVNATNESLEEAIQGGIEEFCIAKGLGKDEASAAANGFIRDGIASIGTMLILSGVGGGVQRARYSNAPLLNRQEQATFALRIRNLNDKLEGKTADKSSISDFGRVYGSIAEQWLNAGVYQEDRVKTLLKMGVDPSQVKEVDGMLNNIWSSVSSDKAQASAFVGGKKVKDAAELLKEATDAGVATIGQDNDGNTIAKINVNGSELNITFNQGVSSEIDVNTKDEGLIRSIEHAARLKPGAWSKMTEEEKQETIDTWHIKKQGNWTITTKSGKKIDGAITKAIVDGTINLTTGSMPQTVWHEYGHGIFDVINQIAFDEDNNVRDENMAAFVQDLAQAFPPKLTGEKFDEEMLADAFRDYLTQQINVVEDNSIFARLKNFLKDLLGITDKAKNYAITNPRNNAQELFNYAMSGQLPMAKAEREKSRAKRNAEAKSETKQEPTPSTNTATADANANVEGNVEATPQEQAQTSTTDNQAVDHDDEQAAVNTYWDNTGEEKQIRDEIAAENPKNENFVIVTPDNGLELNGKYKIVDASSLTDMEGTDIQNRIREGNVNAEMQQQKIGNNINPSMLMESPTSDTGAPIVDSKGRIISGLGRTKGVMHGYKIGKADNYRKAVEAKAKELGIEFPVDAKEPILVRELDSKYSETELVDIATRSNQDSKLARTAAEEAISDAIIIENNGILDLLDVDENGRMLSASNADFMSIFASAINDRSIRRQDGSFSDAAERRAKNAVLAYVFKDFPDKRDLLINLIENADTLGMRNMVNGILKAAPGLSRATKSSPQYDATNFLGTALMEYVKYKQSNFGSINEYIQNNVSLFGGATSDEVLEAMQAVADNTTQIDMFNFVSAYADMALKEIPADNLFGETPKTTLDIIKLANESAKKQKAERVRHSVIAERAAAIVGATTAGNEYNEVVAKYKNTDQWMKAPNGEPTNLTERQWIQVRTPSFKEWFGDWESDPANASKVVDENGEPLVVWHRSEEEFYSFDALKIRDDMDVRGFYFADYRGYNDARHRPHEKAVFLNIRNPYVAEWNGEWGRYKPTVWGGQGVQLEEDGYDGAIRTHEYIAVSPNQIKSADPVTYDDNGNVIPLSQRFNPKKDDIRYSITIGDGITQADAKDKLKELPATVINNHMQIVATLSSNSKGKLLSNAAVSKTIKNGFTAQQHNELAANIDMLFKEAYLAETSPDKNGDINIKSIKRFVAPVQIKDQEAAAWITVKESIEHGHRIYSVEGMQITALPPTVRRALTNHNSAGNAVIGIKPNFGTDVNTPNSVTENSRASVTADTSYMQARMEGDYDAMRTTLDDVAMRSGYPMKVYHGTRSFGFTVIDPELGDDGFSFFTTTSTGVASTYRGENPWMRGTSANEQDLGVYEFYADTTGLLEIDAQGAEWNEMDVSVTSDYDGATHNVYNTRDAAEYARREGYTGVRIKNVIDTSSYSEAYANAQSDVLVFFNPQEQLKSASLETYDDSNSLILPSERFNRGNRDTRWSVNADIRIREATNGITIENLEKSIEDIIENQTIKIVASDSEKIAIKMAAVSFYEKYAKTKILLSTNSYLFFAPDERTVERHNGDRNKAWAEYALHQVTNNHKDDKGQNYRAFNKAKVEIVNPIIEQIVAEDKTEIAQNGNVLFYHQHDNEHFIMLIAKPTEDGNYRADLTDVSSVYETGKMPAKLNPLGAAVNRDALGGVFTSLSTNESIKPNSVGDVNTENRRYSVNLAKTRLRELKPGENCLVERVFAERKMFNFMAGEKIESYNDVAYIFKSLENEAVENAFVALVKNNKPTIVHLGMGAIDATIVDNQAIHAAVERIKPEKIYFIHNHPSGNVESSRADRDIYAELKQAYGDKVQDGIIINLRSGKYGTFNDNSDKQVSKVVDPEKSKKVKVYSFNQKVFNKDFEVEDLVALDDPEKVFDYGQEIERVAAMASSHRLGERNKISLLVLDKRGHAVGNVFLNYTNFTDSNIEEIGREIGYYVASMQGRMAILYGRFDNSKSIKWGLLTDYLGTFKTALLDVVNVLPGDNQWESVRRSGDIDRRFVNEESAPYSPTEPLFSQPDATRFSVATWEGGGRDVVIKYLKKSDLSKTERAIFLEKLDNIAAIAKSLAEETNADGTPKYRHYSNWAQAVVEYDEEGKPIFGVVRPNGDYAFNIDFSTVCKKRRPLDYIFKQLTDRGVVTDENINTLLSAENVVTLQNLIKERGLEIACALCFVDSKRYKIGEVAKNFSNLWNGIIDMRANNPSEYERVLKLAKKRKAGRDIGEDGKKKNPTFYDKTVMLIEDNVDLHEYKMDAGKLISSESYDEFAKDEKTAKIFNLYRSYGGVSKAKDAHMDVPYNNDILQAFTHSTNPNRPFGGRNLVDKTFAVGGVRIQSFSDFVGALWFDYVQMVAELAIRGLPAHTYTKEINCVKLLANTGIKINMSLVPANKGVKWLTLEEGEAQGLVAIWDKDSKPVERYGKVAFYDLSDECFPIKDAFQMRDASGNVGTIMVGVSDAHIELCLADPRIDMVIPYHKSSLNAEVAKMRQIDVYDDYTGVQNTRFADTGKKLGSKDEHGNKREGKDFEYYKTLKVIVESGKHNKDAHREVAKRYVEYCQKRGFLPKFDKFAKNENYYKLLADFRMEDADGNYSPQTAVKCEFDPATIREVATEAIELYEHDMEALPVDEDLDNFINTFLNRIAENNLRKEQEAKARTKKARNSVVADNMQALADEAANALMDADSRSSVTSDMQNQYSIPSNIVAIMAQDRTLGINRPNEHYQKLIDIYGIDMPLEELIDQRDKLLRAMKDDTGHYAQWTHAQMAASAEASNFKTVVENLFSGLAGMGMKASSKAERAWAKALSQMVRNAKGRNLQDLMNDTGFDIVELLLQLPIDEPTTVEPAVPDGEGGIPQPTQDATQTPAAAPNTALTQAMIEERRAKVNERRERILRLLKEWRERERQRKEELERNKANKPKTEADDIDLHAPIPEDEADDSGGESSDHGAESECVEEMPDFTAFIEALKGESIDVNNTEELAALLHIWVDDWVNGSQKDIPDRLKNPLALEKYRKTMVQVLRNMADRMIDYEEEGSSYVAKRIERMIESLNAATNPNQIQNRVSQILGTIQRNAIRLDRKALIRELRKQIKLLAAKGKEFDEMAKNLERKVGGEHELAARYIYQILTWSDDKIAKEAERLMAIIDGRKDAYRDAGQDLDIDKLAQKDVDVHRAMERLNYLNMFGGLRKKTPVEIRQAARQITEWLSKERYAHEQRWAEWQQAKDEVANRFIAAINARKRDFTPSDPNGMQRFGDELIATLRQRLEFITQGSGEAGLEVINEILYIINSGSERLAVVKEQFRQEHEEMLKWAVDGTGKSVNELIRELDELIPEDLNNALITKDQRNRMTWGQVLQLYVSLCQVGYQENIEVNERKGQRQLIEQHLNAYPEFVKLVERMRDIYDSRRNALSKQFQFVTGMPILSPDPLYMPVKMFRGPSDNLEIQFRAWNPFGASFTPRIKNKLDFDLSANIMDMFVQRSTDAAKALAFGVRGMELRSIIARKEVQNAIAQNYGKFALKKIIEQITDTLSDGYKTPSSGFGKAIQAVSSATTYSALSWNLVTAIKQMASFPAWSAVLRGGYKEIFSNMMNYDRKAARELCESEGFLARYGATSFPELFKQSLNDPTQNWIKKFFKSGMTAIQIGDYVASMLVGTGVYKAQKQALMRSGMSEAEAKNRAASITWSLVEECQQSSRLENTPDWLRRQGFLARQLAKFASSPLLQVSHEFHSMRMWINADKAGDTDEVRMWRKRFFNQVIANHVIMPALMYGIAVGFGMALGDEPPEEEELYGDLLLQMMVGPFARVFLIGSIAEGLSAMLINKIGLKAKTYDSSGIAASQYVEKMIKRIDRMGNDIIESDWVSVRDDFLDMLGQVAAPARYVVKASRNAVDYDAREERSKRKRAIKKAQKQKENKTK